MKIPDREHEPGEPVDPANSLDGALREAFAKDLDGGDVPAPSRMPDGGSSVLHRMRPELRSLPPVLANEDASLHSPIVKARAPEPGSGADRMRYQIQGEIARGGIGAVLKVRDVDLGRDVAMKVLRDDREQDQVAVERFIEEAQISGQLQHPGIAPIFELGLHDERRPYFTMKLIRGRTLSSLLADRPSSKSDRRRFISLFEQVCQTVAYAHSKGVIHRDLKPSNVMVGAFAEVQVVDWGLAKVLARGGIADEEREASQESRIDTRRSKAGSGSDDSVPGSVMGTPAYMPPEQAMGDVDRLDERSDVFSLGAMLCEVLSGRPPYLGTREEMLAQAARGDLEEAWGALEACDADPELVRICRSSLSARRKDRPRSASVVAAAISSYLSSVEERAQAERVAAAEARVMSQQDRRARKLTLGLVAAVGAVLVVASASWWIASSSRVRRMTENEEAIRSAVQEAAVLKGKAVSSGNPLDWKDATGAIGRATTLATEKDTGPGIREEVSLLASDIKNGEESALRRLNQESRNRRFLTRLQAIRPASLDMRYKEDLIRADQEHEALFKAQGLDVDHLNPIEFSEMVADQALREELAVVLDRWSVLRDLLHSSEQAEHLIQLAKAVDRDEQRNDLRDAFHAGNAEPIRSFMRTSRAEDLPARTLHLVGRLLLSTGRADEAIGFLEPARRLHPDDFEITLLLARAFGRTPRKYWRHSLRYYTAAQSLRPTSVVVQQELAALLMRTETTPHLREALALLEEAIKARPGRQGLRTKEVTCRLLLGDPTRAGHALEEILQLDPGDDPEAIVDRAYALRMLGRIDEAFSAVKNALALDPDCERAHFQLGVLRARRGDLEGSNHAYRQAIRCFPELVDAHKNLGTQLIRQGDYEAARSSFLQAVELAPLDWKTHNGLSVAQMFLGDFDGSVSTLREAIRLRPLQPHLYINLGFILFDSWDFEEAAAAFQAAIELRPDDPMFHFALGRALSFGKDYERTLTAFREGDRLYSLPRPTPDLVQTEIATVQDNGEVFSRVARRILEGADGFEGVGRGVIVPTTDQAWIGVATVAYVKGLYATAARYYSAAFACEKTLESWDIKPHLYRASVAAALTGCGQSVDGPSLEDAERASWRTQALEGLWTFLWLAEKTIEFESEVDVRQVLRDLAYFEEDPNLAWLRDEEALAELSPEEREACESFWSELSAVLVRNL